MSKLKFMLIPFSKSKSVLAVEQKDNVLCSLVYNPKSVDLFIYIFSDLKFAIQQSKIG